MLRRCSSLTIDFNKYGIDLMLTLGTYNFNFWFDGHVGYVQLSAEPLVIAEVYTDGSVNIWGESCDKGYIPPLINALGLKEDLGEFFDIASKDPLLKGFSECCRGWRLRSSSLWWSLVVGICQQNASFRQGWGMLFKLIKNFRKYVRIGNRLIPLLPLPKDVIRYENLLRSSGLGYRSETVINVAKAFIRGDLSDDLPMRLSLKELEYVLMNIKGVGHYTARLAIALSSRRYELPPIDRWLRALASLAYGISEREVEGYWVSRWGRWSALAAIATTITLDAEPLRRALRRIREGLITPMVTDKPSPTNMWRFKEL